MRLALKLEWTITNNAVLFGIILQNYINYFAPKRIRSGCFLGREGECVCVWVCVGELDLS